RVASRAPRDARGSHRSRIECGFHLDAVVVDALERELHLRPGKPAGSLPMRDGLGLHAEFGGDLDTRDHGLVIHASLIPPKLGSRSILRLRRGVPKSYQARY